MLPTIHDPIEADDPARWFPSNQEAAQLVACLLACKDVTRALRGLTWPEPMADRRGLILLLTPVISLLKNTLELNRKLGQHDVSLWPQEDRNKILEYGRKLKKRNSGPLNHLRNERSAHQDPDKFSDVQARERAQIPSREIVELLGECLIVLLLRMNHKRAYAWSRFPDPSQPNLIEVQQAGCIGPIRVLANSENEIVDILGASLGDPGLLAAKKIVDATIEEHNAIAVMCSPLLPRIRQQVRDIPGY